MKADPSLVPALRRQTKDYCCDEIRNAAADEIERLEAANEELIRGMTEMAERFTARMNSAAAQIYELRAESAQ